MHLECFSFFRWQDRYSICCARELVSGFAEFFARGHVASFFLQRKKGNCEHKCERTQQRLHKKLAE